jgi:hypothetical protein
MMADGGSTPAPAAGVTPPSPPVPGSLEAARQAGRKVGEAYGEFKAWQETFLELFTATAATGGVVLWDRLPPERRLEVIGKVQHAYDTLPALPASTSIEMAAALRQGFQEGAKAQYESERLLTRAVWVACELAKAFAVAKASAPVSVVAIRSAADGFTDCAARTASRAVLEMTGVEVPADQLVRNFGLPMSATQGFEAAVSYARNWFTKMGITLAARVGGFGPVREGGTIGRYVIFFKGGPSGGHVVFGEVTATEVRIIDDQKGKVWSSLMQAQNYLGMKAATSSRIESITLP